MDPAFAIDIGKQALWITLVISGPLLLVGLVVGLFIGIIQAVTQIHEMTLTFIPKILAVVGVFFVLMPWMAIKLIDYTVNLFNQIPTVIH
ncbi:MAG TPA: flagellar biosynthesis protein FliQ [Chitinivibrionales bacterium]